MNSYLKKTKEFSRTCLDKGEGVSRESLYIFPGVTAPHGEIPMTWPRPTKGRRVALSKRSSACKENGSRWLQVPRCECHLIFLMGVSSGKWPYWEWGVCVCVSLGGLVMCVLFVCARLDKPWGSVRKWRNDQIKVKRWWAWPHPTTIFKSWINHETKSNRKHHPLSSLSPLLWSELFASAISNPMGHGFTFQIPTGQWTFEDLSQQRLKVAKLKRRLSHEIHARECRQVILPHDILPRNLKKNISPPTCFFWKYGAPPKSHGWKSHFPNKNQPGPGGPRLWRLQTQLLGIVQRNFQALGVSWKGGHVKLLADGSRLGNFWGRQFVVTRFSWWVNLGDAAALLRSAIILKVLRLYQVIGSLGQQQVKLWWQFLMC